MFPHRLSACFLALATLPVVNGAPSPLHSWSLEKAGWSGAATVSQGERVEAKLGEAPSFADDGAWQLAGSRGLVIEGIKVETLPEKAISVEAQVAIDTGQKWGGIYSFAQDNGNYERGWLLGYNERSFLFWISTGGGMLQVVADEPFEKGRFYHVVGTYDGKTIRLYVDGKLSGERAAEGAIAYPESAFYSIGGYRDEDEDYPLRGKLRSAKLYAEAMDGAAVLAGARASGVEMPLDFAVQPALRFVSPSSAKVTWESAEPGGAAVSFGTTRRLGEVVRSEKADGEHSVLLEGLLPGTKYFYKIGRAVRGERNFSPTYEFTTTTNFSKLPVPGTAREGGQAAKAAEILEKTGVAKGYALVMGGEERELALELARAGDLNVFVAENDAAKVEEARRYLYSKGVHGARVSVLDLSTSGDILPLTSGMVNLLVAREPISDAEVNRLLVPGRGKAFWLGSGNVVERARIDGSADWTHQYGDAGNSAASDDLLGGATTSGGFALAWLGRPGADFGVDRNPRMPAPLSASGRLFHQGMNRLVALDAHNGAILWGLEAPDLRRINLPRDCSNWCADSGYLYVAVGDRAWALHAETGERLRTFSTSRKGEDGDEFVWGYIAREGGMLLGSAVKSKAGFKDFWGKERWFDGKAGSSAVAKICSDSLFGYRIDSAGQEAEWTYQRGLILNSTISASDGRVYFVETRNPNLLEGAKRRLSGGGLWKEQYLVALDSATGKVHWERPLDTQDGSVSFYLQAAGGRLLATASNTQFHLYTFDAASGEPIWEKSVAWPDDHHSGHMQHPVVMGDMVYLQPNGINVATGEIVTSKVGRREGCHTYVAAGGALLYRGVGRVVSLWDRETETVTNWPRLRPSCWLSTIPAAGMLLMPEAGGGCSCGGWMETSVGFLPKVRLGELGDAEVGAAATSEEVKGAQK